MKQFDIINQKARQISKVINCTTVPTLSLDPTEDDAHYDGSFTTIYQMVRKGRIKYMTYNDQIVGISIDSGTGSTDEDNITAARFAQAYSFSKMINYLETAFALKNAGVVVNDIVEQNGNVLIYLYRQGKILNGCCDTVVEISQDKVEQATMENIRQLLDEALEAQSGQQIPITQTHNEDLPSEVEVSEDEVFRYGNLANYLRKTYGHYLAKGHRFNSQYIGSTKTFKATDIEWGRKI